jgi:outer membrane protein OmpA-like peptidoglycan-associated protein
VVEGHTDARGTDNYNDKLADERADAVANFLVAQGVSSDRMTALGLGESAPRVPDPYDPVNRRVEMRLNLE